MTLFSTTRSKIAAAAVLAAATATVGTAAFASQAGPARAPYAQAGALVEASGALSQSKGIASVQKPSAGTYCIKFTDAARLDPQKLIPTAVIGASGDTPWDATIMVRTDPWSGCGNATDTVTVFTGTNAGPADLPFYIAIH